MPILLTIICLTHMVIYSLWQAVFDYSNVNIMMDRLMVCIRLWKEEEERIDLPLSLPLPGVDQH